MAHLYGKKVMLREYRAEDYEHMRRWVNNPRIVETLRHFPLSPFGTEHSEVFGDGHWERLDRICDRPCHSGSTSAKSTL